MRATDDSAVTPFEQAAADGLELREGELFSTRTQLWLDSRRRRLRAFVSHAHSDHIAPHRMTVLSSVTDPLFRHRVGARPTLPLAFGEPRRIGQATVELAPAGHILGSAQIAITDEHGKRLVYTGDFKLRPHACAEPGVVLAADVLVMESTYGEPSWCFPDPIVTADLLCDSVKRALERGQTPVVLAYPLGKAQEVLHVLTQRDIGVIVDSALLPLVQLYEAHGVTFGPYTPWSSSAVVVSGRAYLVAAGAQRHERVQRLPRLHTIFLSGWGIRPEMRFRYGVDEMIPMSDHADFGELQRYIAESRPRRVYTVHGTPSFARHLRHEGIEAFHLPDHQPSLFDVRI